MKPENCKAELITTQNQIDLWTTEIKFLHEDIRVLEQNIIRAGGLLISALILSGGLFVALGTKDSVVANIFPAFYPFFCILLSLIGSAFLIGTSYLGHGIVRADIYIRHLNNISQEKLGVLISGWEDWKHEQRGLLTSSIERVFYSFGHGLFVVFTCIMSLGVAMVGILSFCFVDKSLLGGYIKYIAWGGFGFALLMLIFAASFFSLTCWITLGVLRVKFLKRMPKRSSNRKRNQKTSGPPGAI